MIHWEILPSRLETSCDWITDVGSQITCVYVTDRIAIILVVCVNVVSIFLVTRNHEFCHVLLRVGKAFRPQAKFFLDRWLSKLTHFTFRKLVFTCRRRQIHSLCFQFHQSNTQTFYGIIIGISEVFAELVLWKKWWWTSTSYNNACLTWR